MSHASDKSGKNGPADVRRASFMGDEMRRASRTFSEANIPSIGKLRGVGSLDWHSFRGQVYVLPTEFVDLAQHEPEYDVRWRVFEGKFDDANLLEGKGDIGAGILSPETFVMRMYSFFSTEWVCINLQHPPQVPVMLQRNLEFCFYLAIMCNEGKENARTVMVRNLTT